MSKTFRIRIILAALLAVVVKAIGGGFLILGESASDWDHRPLLLLLLLGIAANVSTAVVSPRRSGVLHAGILLTDFLMALYLNSATLWAAVAIEGPAWIWLWSLRGRAPGRQPFETAATAVLAFWVAGVLSFSTLVGHTGFGAWFSHGPAAAVLLCFLLSSVAFVSGSPKWGWGAFLLGVAASAANANFALFYLSPTFLFVPPLLVLIMAVRGLREWPWPIIRLQPPP